MNRNPFLTANFPSPEVIAEDVKKHIYQSYPHAIKEYITRLSGDFGRGNRMLMAIKRRGAQNCESTRT